MANLEIEGKISLKLPVQSGQSARGLWERQDFVLEYQDGNFPTSVCFTAWGSDKVKDLGQFQVGDAVKVAFNVRGREYNGKWYNDLQIWKLAPAGAPAAPAAPAVSAAAPAAMPSAFDAPAPTLDDMPPEDLSDDDLPF